MSPRLSSRAVVLGTRLILNLGFASPATEVFDNYVPMSWDRVIQDSDEDEPLEGDGLPPPVEPLQHLESAKQHDHVPANYTNHNANQHDSAPDEGIFPRLNVNFDEFLQSQERNHAGLSSSQVRREERWIPSTSEGGSGSVGMVYRGFLLKLWPLLTSKLAQAP